jgi:hypothetical protein
MNVFYARPVFVDCLFISFYTTFMFFAFKIFDLKKDCVYLRVFDPNLNKQSTKIDFEINISWFLDVLFLIPSVDFNTA